MLKGIPNILSPELLKILMEMGHGDEIVIADGNFPAASHAQRLVRADGHGVPPLLDAILALYPLDTFVTKPVAQMAVVEGTDTPTPEIWKTYNDLLKSHGYSTNKIERMERFAFYERTKNAYAIVATGESAIYANIILKKGIL